MAYKGKIHIIGFRNSVERIKVAVETQESKLDEQEQCGSEKTSFNDSVMWLQGHLDPFRTSEEAVDKRNKKYALNGKYFQNVETNCTLYSKVGKCHGRKNKQKLATNTL